MDVHGLLLIDRMASVTHQWSALTPVTHRYDAVNSSPQKPPATYTRVNDFGPHTDSIFRGRLIREGDLYASIYGKCRQCALVFTRPRDFTRYSVSTLKISWEIFRTFSVAKRDETVAKVS